MGVSAKRSVSYMGSTFYGVSNDGLWELSGCSMWSYQQYDSDKGNNGEIIRERIELDHFNEGDIEIDIYLDADKRILKMKRVGYLDEEKYEAMITNLYTGNNKEGWIPNFAFGGSAREEQQIRIARIVDISLYGQEAGIEWC